MSLPAILALVLAAQSPAREPALRVCADPNNLPFSNARGEGFENKLAALIGQELGLPVRYTWWAQRRGFLRNTLEAHACDVVMGVPVELHLVRATRPYYRSTYVFAARADRALAVTSFDDPALRRVKIGVPLVGGEGPPPPPAHALARRGIVDNVVGFTVYGDYRDESPPTRVMQALVAGEIDIAAVWGPVAGYFARRPHARLRLTMPPPTDDGLPLVFAIGLGVRKEDEALARSLDGVLVRRRRDIDKLLGDYGVPRAR
jgi:mxaJ protein